MVITHDCKENGSGYKYHYKVFYDELDELWYVEEAYYHILEVDYCPFCGVKL